MADTCSPAPTASICGRSVGSGKAGKARLDIRACRGLDIGGNEYSGYHCNPGSTSRHHRGDILRPHATDCDTRPAPRQSGKPGEAVRAEPCPCVSLGCRVTPGAYAPVIRAVGPFALELTADRGADDESWRRDSAGQVYRHIIRSQVHTRGASGDGDIRAVVHQHRYLEGFDQTPSQVNQLPRL